MQNIYQNMDLEELRDCLSYIAVRLFSLRHTCPSEQEANVAEAANFVADAVRDIQGAISAEPAPVCTCGKCDGCVAARSDEHHDRLTDGRLMQTTPGGRRITYA